MRRPVLDFGSYRVLSFDCYGTLIDWEGGILAAFESLLMGHGVSVPDDELLRLYGELERDGQGHRPFQSYRQVLSGIVSGLGERLGFRPDGEELGILAESMKRWRPFGDTVDALRALKERYRLAIISNVDRDLFDASARQLGVPFDWVVTSQEVGEYKPSLRNFRTALERIAVSKSEVLHVAQSLYHDVEPAQALGLSTVWVNRAGARSTPLRDVRPDLEVRDLAGLVKLMERAEG